MRTELLDLAEKLKADVYSDGKSFQRAARILQSYWRISQGYPLDKNARPKAKEKALGSRLEKKFAVDSLANYLTPGVRKLVKKTLAEASPDQLFSKPRIYNDLLSSQPLCFNLFGELRLDLKLATSVFKSLQPSKVKKVTSIQFEYSPERGSDNFTSDRSAFDVFVEYDNTGGAPCFFGIEVKYHENLKGKAAKHRDRYIEIAEQMKCFRSGSHAILRKQPLQQLWRDHLLVGVSKQKLGYADGQFILVYPGPNTHCRSAVFEYRKHLIDSSTFETWTIEEIVSVLRLHTDATWVEEFYQRYLKFDLPLAS